MMIQISEHFMLYLKEDGQPEKGIGLAVQMMVKRNRWKARKYRASSCVYYTEKKDKETSHLALPAIFPPCQIRFRY